MGKLLFEVLEDQHLLVLAHALMSGSACMCRSPQRTPLEPDDTLCLLMHGEDFFTSQFGQLLTMAPNYEDLFCKLLFGQKTPPYAALCH